MTTAKSHATAVIFAATGECDTISVFSCAVLLQKVTGDYTVTSRKNTNLVKIN